MDNEFLNEKPRFFKEMNRYTMIFKSDEYEEEFQKFKFERKNIFVLIGFSIFFNMMLALIRNFLIFFHIYFDIEDSHFAPMNASPVALASPLIGIIFEGIFLKCKKLKLLRGFVIIIISLIGGLFSSTDYSLYMNHLEVPLFEPFFLINLIGLIIICFIYAANWLCGSIQIMMILGTIDIYILFYPWPWNVDKPFLIVLTISTAFSMILAIYALEYFQRKTVFMRIELERQRKALKDVLVKLPEPLIISQKGDIKWVNKSFEEIKESEDKTPNKENLNLGAKKVSNILPMENQIDNKFIVKNMFKKNEAINLLQIIEESKSLQKEEFILHQRNGKNKYYEISTSILHIKNVESLLYIVKDLNSFRKMEKLKHKQKYLQIYFASITHDFRTPLSIISGNLELLSIDEESIEKKRIINNINNATTILSLLVQDILDFSQLKAGTLKINVIEFNLRNEFMIIFNLFIEKYQAKGLYLFFEFDNEVPEIAYNDPNRLKQILMNLISNAFKFTNNGGVTVKVELSNYSNKITVKVHDTGVGISKENQNKLFKNFEKIQEHQHLNPNGVGLGLVICKKIIEKLGGSISFESQLNEGTTFNFDFTLDFRDSKTDFVIEVIKENIDHKKFTEEIKEDNYNLDHTHRRMTSKENFLMKNENFDCKELSTPNENKILIHVSQNRNCECSKLLIVDDENPLRKILIEYSLKIKIRADEAENGLIALRKVKEKMNSSCCPFYKLILIDYYMPFLDGINSAIQIKEALSFNFMDETKIILLTGLSSEDNDIQKYLNGKPLIEIETKPLPFKKFKDLIFKYI